MRKQSSLPGLDVPDKAMIDPAHAEEKRLFEVMLAGSQYPWVGDYLALLDEGWYWRDAVFIAWKGTPKRYREPGDQDGLADVMGISGRTLKGRLAKNPAIRVRAARQVTGRAMERVDEVMDALIDSATSANYKSHPDRKLFLEITGVYTPKQGIELGAAPDVEDLSQLSREELARLAGVANGE
ncbi:MAG: hypothetical protein KJ063_02260 [Anaerolineae bacterium]|nr:hypothetical protein [Anaerolineae bacterium]